ncbi:MAG: hypothetical protein AAFQ05_07450, partial [Pseudomonadota bacterium]
IAGCAAMPAMEKIDRVHTVGPLMEALHHALPGDKQGVHVLTSEAMAPHLRDLVQAGDTILVKGSLSMAMARIVTGIRDLGWRLPDSAARDAAKREQTGTKNSGT